MATFEIEQYELHVQKYRVEATSEAEAIVKLFDGKGEPVDGTLDFVEVADDYGLPADEFPDLVDDLRDLGVCVDIVIPSIRCVSEV